MFKLKSKLNWQNYQFNWKFNFINQVLKIEFLFFSYRYQFFLQIKKDILDGKLNIPEFESSAQLFAYALQCKSKFFYQIFRHIFYLKLKNDLYLFRSIHWKGQFFNTIPFFCIYKFLKHRSLKWEIFKNEASKITFFINYKCESDIHAFLAH